MGPSVKFVSCINGSFSKRKNYGSICFVKRPNQGGGFEGGLAKDQTFPGFFPAPFPNSFIECVLCVTFDGMFNTLCCSFILSASTQNIIHFPMLVALPITTTQCVSVSGRSVER